MASHSARSVLVIFAVSPVDRRPGCHFLLIIIIIIIGTRLNGKWPCARKRLNLETKNRCVILTAKRITVAEWVASGLYNIIIIRDRIRAADYCCTMRAKTVVDGTGAVRMRISVYIVSSSGTVECTGVYNIQPRATC